MSSQFLPSGVFFLLAPLVVGFLPAALTFALRPHAAEAIGLTRVRVPAWVFVVVWLIIYPSMGITSWLLWKQVSEPEVRVPLVVVGAGLLQSTTFWFTDSLRTTAVLDATGILFAALATFVVAQYAPVAALWLLPWLVWMPVTFILKAVTLHTETKGNPDYA